MTLQLHCSTWHLLVYFSEDTLLVLDQTFLSPVACIMGQAPVAAASPKYCTLLFCTFHRS